MLSVGDVVEHVSFATYPVYISDLSFGKIVMNKCPPMLIIAIPGLLLLGKKYIFLGMKLFYTGNSNQSEMQTMVAHMKENTNNWQSLTLVIRFYNMATLLVLNKL